MTGNSLHGTEFHSALVRILCRHPMVRYVVEALGLVLAATVLTAWVMAVIALVAWSQAGAPESVSGWDRCLETRINSGPGEGSKVQPGPRKPTPPMCSAKSTEFQTNARFLGDCYGNK
jgi:hypothetical protein